MTYTYNDQAVHEAIAGGKVIIRRPIGMSDKNWIKYAEGVVKALDNRALCTPLGRGEFWFSTVDHIACGTATLGPLPDGETQESPSMKLADILARELKVWPEGCKVITQDSDGYVVSAKDIDVDSLHFDHNAWSGDGGPYMEIHDLASDHKTSIVTRAEWQAAVDALNAPKVDIVDGNVSLGVLIEMGYLKPVRLETPSYDFSAWPPERFDCGLLPSLYVQSFGRSKRHQPVKVKPKSTAQENTEFLEARVKLLEAELAERRKEAKLPLHIKVSDSDLLHLLRSQSDNTLVTIDSGGRTVATIRRDIPVANDGDEQDD